MDNFFILLNKAIVIQSTETEYFRQDLNCLTQVSQLQMDLKILSK